MEKKKISNQVAIKLEDVNFSYDNVHPTLSNISFEIQKNEYICIVGSNGSGKSTLSKIIATLIKPNSGKYYIFDDLVRRQNVQNLKKRIGVIFQNPDNQFIGITSEDDIAFGLENYCVNNAMMRPIIYNAAEIMGITDLLTKEVFELSGGQKQKVAITSVVTLIPDIIIFDESTSMLDPKSKNAIKLLMKHLQTEYDKTIISITHDMEELIQATKILCLNQGKLVKFDTLDAFVNNYHFLVDNKLDLPNNLKLIKVLNEKGLNLKPTLETKKLVEQICK